MSGTRKKERKENAVLVGLKGFVGGGDDKSVRIRDGDDADDVPMSMWYVGGWSLNLKDGTRKMEHSDGTWVIVAVLYRRRLCFMNSQWCTEGLAPWP